MMNVEQITSQLAMMPDASLQKYAMMHKDDPYIMALAVSESRRRKQMRAAGAMQNPAAQPQPKVADQALMEMGGGVDQLPVQDMDFAGGGIVAFAEGGKTYETPYDRMNRENRERAAREEAERLAAIEAAGNSTMPYSEQMSRLGSAVVGGLSDLGKTLVSAPGYGLSKDSPAPASDVPYDPATATRRSAYETQGAPGSQGTPAAAGGLGATPEAAALKGAGIGAPSVKGAQQTAEQFYDTKSMRDDLEKYQQEEKAAVEAARKRRLEGKPEGKAYSKFEEMLQQEEAGAAKERDEATGVAVLKAGLAMMSGTSPNAFANIGKGAMEGLGEYTGAMKDLKKAAKERQKAFADIENARRAEERDDWKTARDFEDKADARLAKAREVGVKGIMDITGKSAEIASGIYKTQVTEAGSMQRTAMLAGARDGGGDKQTLNELKALQTNLQNQLKTEFNKEMRASINAQLAQVNARIAQMAGLGTMGGAPGAPSPGGTMSGWGKASVVNP
jgi:hypothetical protein